MNFIAGEGVERQIVEILRREGHHVWYVVEMASGISDTTVLGIANKHNALLLTADKISES